MKRALVLSGGGSRGAYEIGVWQALDEMKISFSAVYGASIGALNAALFAQGNLSKAISLWQNITISQVVAIEDDEDFSIDHMVSRKRDVIPFLLENARHLRMDISPLEAMVREHVSEAKLRASGMDFGVMAFKVPQMQAAPITLDVIPEGGLADWIIASASCFPLFPARHIDGQRYIDGGYYDNLPIDMAVERGAEEIVAVELHPEHTHPEYARMPWLKTIKPLHNLGGFLDFNPQLLQRSRRMGYYDAMKQYGALDGFLYTFQRVNPLHISRIARRYAHLLMRFDAEAIRRSAAYSGQAVDAPLQSAVERETGLKPLAWKDVWLRGLELCAQAMGFRIDALYSADALLGRMLAFSRGGGVAGALTVPGIRDAAKLGSRGLTAWLYRAMSAGGSLPGEGLSPECLRWLSEYPRETAAALFLCCADSD